MNRLFFLVLIFFLSAQTGMAQVSSNDFTINVLAGGDITPPTTPTLLTIDPVATTQIDISWSLSTDNFAVSGYSVIRDGAPIATTTLLSYSDTGLTASTTYSYEVRAFDLALNYSSSSNSLATTTPNIYTPPPDLVTGPQEGTAARVVVDDFYVEEGISTTSLNFITARPARFEVRWGRTDAYELGYMVSNVYTKDHAILLTSLEPGTIYEYEITAYAPHGNKPAVLSGTFTTLSEAQVVSPLNVSRFRGVQIGDGVDLSWQMPDDTSISHVRIVRSHLGFPEHPQDGAIVFQGYGESYLDTSVLTQYSPVYYTAFVYDEAGNVSSGAVTIVYDDRQAENNGGTSETKEPPFVGVPGVTDEATSSINSDRVTVDMKMPQPSDISLRQGDRTYSFIDSNIELDTNQPFVLSLPKTAITGNLKSIIVTFLDPTNNKNAYSYLLRLNQDKTEYTATISAIGVAGRSQLKLEIYDYEAFVIASYQVPLLFVDSPALQGDNVVFPDAVFLFPYKTVMSILLLIVLLLIMFLVYRRLHEDNN